MLEGFFYEDQQELDSFFETGVVGDKLGDRLKMQDAALIIGSAFLQASKVEMIPCLEILKAARAAGIRVVGVELSEKTKAIVYGVEGDAYEKRIKMMNYTAYQIITHETSLSKFSGKWCALMGAGHASQTDYGLGVAELTGATVLCIMDTDKDEAMTVVRRIGTITTKAIRAALDKYFGCIADLCLIANPKTFNHKLIPKTTTMPETRVVAIRVPMAAAATVFRLRYGDISERFKKESAPAPKP